MEIPLQPAVPPRRPWWRQSLYRIGQFWRGLHASVTAQEQAQVTRILTPDAAKLFFAMPRDAQRHSLDVLASLHSAGYRHPALDAAALLHDVGKLAAAEGGVQLSLWVRGPLVLLETFAPGIAQRWAAADPATGWRYLLYVHDRHPAIGAEWAAQAGCDELCCRLIAYHQTPSGASPPGAWRAWLLALQWADAEH